MFLSFLKREPSDLDNAITSLYIRLAEIDPGDEEYPKLISHIKELTAIKDQSGSWKPSPDAVVTALGSVLGILVIVAYEQKHVMASKGLGFIMKAKA